LSYPYGVGFLFDATIIAHAKNPITTPINSNAYALAIPMVTPTESLLQPVSDNPKNEQGNKNAHAVTADFRERSSDVSIPSSLSFDSSASLTSLNTIGLSFKEITIVRQLIFRHSFRAI